MKHLKSYLYPTLTTVLTLGIIAFGQFRYAIFSALSIPISAFWPIFLVAIFGIILLTVAMKKDWDREQNAPLTVKYMKAMEAVAKDEGEEYMTAPTDMEAETAVAKDEGEEYMTAPTDIVSAIDQFLEREELRNTSDLLQTLSYLVTQDKIGGNPYAKIEAIYPEITEKLVIWGIPVPEENIEDAANCITKGLYNASEQGEVIKAILLGNKPTEEMKNYIISHGNNLLLQQVAIAHAKVDWIDLLTRGKIDFPLWVDMAIVARQLTSLQRLQEQHPTLNNYIKIYHLRRGACYGNLDIMKWLFAKKPALKKDINKKGTHGETAIGEAARMDHTDIVDFLKRKGADTTIKDNEDMSANDWQSYHGHHPITNSL